jgi:hypothetical protein
MGKSHDPTIASTVFDPDLHLESCPGTRYMASSGFMSGGVCFSHFSKSVIPQVRLSAARDGLVQRRLSTVPPHSVHDPTPCTIFQNSTSAFKHG